ncbi:hypothetical protein TorRG33x02_113900 [Trema orientale]|uniref:Uncharacterized protein n=1 Tax=Trema orientale TaxID=63057 RepID=A0A2P5F4S4_TREOI|nr:hypothetical protein TorRG33x02_113900 [Trema orientale]
MGYLILITEARGVDLEKDRGGKQGDGKTTTSVKHGKEKSLSKSHDLDSRLLFALLTKNH